MRSYSKYIGVPFREKGRSMDGADCWGLLKLIYSNELGIDDLPDFADRYENTRDKFNIPLLLHIERQRWEQVERPQETDAVMFNLAGLPIHVGIMISEDQFIHVTKGINACIESIDSPVWANRVQGFYRYE